MSDVDLAARRQFFAEEIQAVANLRTPALVEALATVPRERFLRSGPWLIRSESDFSFGGPRTTRDADPRHVYHNVGIAIDASRQLFNGMPSLIASCVDALRLMPGDHVLHVGCGLGYYSALMAHCVGPTGRLVAVDVDEALAAEAHANLASWGWVQARHGNGIDIGADTFDAILVNAGMSHPHEVWLRALRPQGRLVVPLTGTIEQMGPIGKGFVVLISDRGDGEVLDARVLTMVLIYSAVGIRDAAMNDRLGQALLRSPWPAIKALRRDSHPESPSCWLHGETFCLELGWSKTVHTEKQVREK